MFGVPTVYANILNTLKNVGKKDKWTGINNQNYFDFYFNEIMNELCGQFTALNFPKEIDTITMTKWLIIYGSLAFFYDKYLERFIVLPYNIFGEPDMYGNPIKLRCYSPFRNITYNKQDEFEILWDNCLKENLLPIVHYYARRMADIAAAIDVNINNQKTPRIIPVTEEQRLSIENLISKVNRNYSFIPIVKSQFGFGDIKPVDISVPYVADKMRENLENVRREYREFFGIPHVIEKKERLITSEVDTQAVGSELNAKSRLNARKIFCKNINEKYGLKTNFKFNVNIK